MTKFPELDAAKVVETDYLTDGFTLAGVPDGTQDFLVANHVLEHATNPIEVLRNWGRVVRPGGILYIAVPMLDEVFDRGRPRTTLEHIVSDYELCARGDLSAFAEMNRAHYREWITISEPNVLAERGEHRPPIPIDELEQRVDERVAVKEEIHFHTFDATSFAALLTYCTAQRHVPGRVVEVRDAGFEAIGIVQRASAMA